MSEFGYRPPHIRLLDKQLTLDPQIEATLAEINARMAAREWLDKVLNPRWVLSQDFFQGLAMAPPNPLTMKLPAPGGPAWKPGEGPATPRAGDMSDVTGALYKLPIVQELAKRAQEQALRDVNRLGKEWSAASGWGKFGMITMGTVVAGGMIAPILANRPTRLLAFDMIKDKDIPVPLLPGYSFRIMQDGGGVKLPLGNKAVVLDSHLQVPGGAPVNFGVTINVDLAELVKALK
ncbi:hypothetical protein [Fuscibacter oryzae]|uniref:Uncharacterized protein n=1 Tax=Fuscibacter oryzae TaxID=2803939 RepID=A0A8J7MVQ2_9RHOB|nr:hypothetical protein [Fuscibacter oryzae]MBL4928694.1 hypothetical protein [Fuscibacter oryzae]